MERAIDQIAQAARKYRIDAITFNDDILTHNLVWSKEFLRRYKKEIGLPFDCNLRVGPFSPKEILMLLKDAGCVEVKYGIESGNKEIREEVLNRKMSNKQIIETIKTANDLGLKTGGYVMVGLPEESPKKFIETIRLVIGANIEVARISVFQPYMGTRLYDYCLEKKYFDNRRKSVEERHDTVLNLPNFGRRDILYFFKNFEQILKYGKGDKQGLKKNYSKMCLSLYLVYPSHWLYWSAKLILLIIRVPIIFFTSIKNEIYE